MILERNPTFQGAPEHFRQEVKGKGLSERQQEYIDSLPRVETKSAQNNEVLAELFESNQARAQKNRLPDSNWMKRNEFQRRGQIMHHLTFLEKLRAHGIKCWYNPPIKGLVGLRAIRKGYEQLGIQYICAVKVGYTTEFDFFHYDRYGVELNRKYIGWRSVLLQLINKGILTEREAHKIFGPPLLNEASSLYRRALQQTRKY